jgi:hypothetical protein
MAAATRLQNSKLYVSQFKCDVAVNGSS